MQKRSLCWLIMPFLVSACATPAPVAVTCPLPPQVPQALILDASASTEVSLSQQLDGLMLEFKASLARAMRPN